MKLHPRGPVRAPLFPMGHSDPTECETGHDRSDMIPQPTKNQSTLMQLLKRTQKIQQEASSKKKHEFEKGQEVLSRCWGERRESTAQPESKVKLSKSSKPNEGRMKPNSEIKCHEIEIEIEE